MPASPIYFSRRLPWEEAPNRLTRALAERRARGLKTIDLTETNPTRVGLPYPQEELAEILRRAASSRYDPDPRGLRSAREALAAYLSRPGDPADEADKADKAEADEVDPDDLVLTASTSESYSHLFKLFADPGDEILSTAPSYPLLDSLAGLESLTLLAVPLDPAAGFALDVRQVAAALSPRTRLFVAIHPGNPTGRYLTTAEQAALQALAADRDLPLVSDEVFADFPLVEPAAGDRAGPTAATAEAGDALAFSLGGLSKSAGLPGWKLGWIRVGGPADLRHRALAALEHVADSYLSVATPVQRALPEILALAPGLRAALLARLRGNLAALRQALAATPGVEILAPAAGWSVVLRLGTRADGQTDEDLALALLDREGVLVHPGYFFDFATADYLVLSLLPEPAEFAAGIAGIAGIARLLT